MERSPQRIEQEQTYSALFHRLNWEMHKHSMETLEVIDLTMPQMIVLIKLDDRGGSATMCELVDCTLQSGPTLTRIVDRMVAAGLVSRERDDNDRRVVHIVLTERGRSKKAEAVARAEQEIACLTAALDDDELSQLNALGRKLLLGMDELRAQCEARAHETSPSV